MNDFNDDDYWRSIILYGLNQATYKIALGKTLVSLSEKNLNHYWADCGIPLKETLETHSIL